jgi:hypothetical protein
MWKIHIENICENTYKINYKIICKSHLKKCNQTVVKPQQILLENYVKTAGNNWKTT